MRKYLIFIILFGLMVAARGQTIEDMTDVDLSRLPQPTQFKELHYWFDDNEVDIHVVNDISDDLFLDVSQLIEGLHFVHFQVIGSDDAPAYVSSAVFLKIGTDSSTATANKLMYWYDDEENISIVDISGGVQILDTSHLIEGLHSIHFQVIGTDDIPAYVSSAVFLKTGTGSSTAIAKKLMYWYDNEENISTVDISEGVQILDASHLIDGLHTIHYQVLCENGMMTASKSSFFLRISHEAGMPVAKSVRYWFDDDASSVKVANVTNGIQQLEVSGLKTGLHSIHYQLIDDKDNVCPPVTGLFLKKYTVETDNLKNSITEYRYWLNDNCSDIHTMAISNPTESYQLISLLPVRSEPIRSSSFHFEITDNVPAIYAKNDFHIRFQDAQGSFTDAEKSFVDYRVKQEVTNVTLLESGVRATSNKPASNKIIWYKLEAEPGDSLQFKLDHAATIQLFAPSGEEVYKVFGSESVEWNGLHVWDSGTYYLALHDVTAQQGTTISIDYNHIDKYAVLRQDVCVVGNGGCSTITFDGNGFRDLYAVDLYNDQGDIIQNVFIGHESDATSSVAFDFSDVPVGQYHGLFHFTEEDRTYNNLVSVEEAQDILIEATVNYPSTFLAGRNITYALKIKNKGNMTAYQVPLYMCIKGETKGNIDIKGLDLKSIFYDVDLSGTTMEERQELSDIEAEIGMNHYFMGAKIYDAVLCDSQYVKTAYFFIDIPPTTEKTIYISLCADTRVDLKFMTPNTMNPLVTKAESDELLNAKRKDVKFNYCCWRDQIECLLSLASDVAGLADFILAFDPSCTASSIASISNCLIGVIKQCAQSVGNSICGNADHGMSDTYEIFSKMSNGFSLFGSLASCLTTVLPWKKVTTIIKGINTGVGIIGGGPSGFTTLTDCCIAFVEMFVNPTCPSNPLIGGGTSSLTFAFDPNDIYGYTAESGSHAVKNDLTDVYYTIEFENDPEFATASAHDIYVSDQLDATMFDLSTFAPTRVQIGSKSAELNGDKNFVTTIDMRPEINAIAQVEGTFDESTGLAQWHISSLDPMTMEPTNEPLDGVLPVNTNGSGIGQISFDIALKDGLAHGTEVPNQATIVFDTNEPILTPVWTNVIDRIAPESHITEVEQVNDGETATVSIEATDDGSGPWRYDVYVQYGTGAWFRAAENVPVNSTATVKLYSDIEHHFYAVAKDMAGNVEEKEPVSEFTLNVGTVIIKGDANGDGSVTITDAVAVVNYILGNPSDNFHETAADVNGDGNITITDAVGIVNIILNGGASAPALSEPEEAGQVPE